MEKQIIDNYIIALRKKYEKEIAESKADFLVAAQSSSDVLKSQDIALTQYMKAKRKLELVDEISDADNINHIQQING